METPDWFDESQFVPTPEDRLPAADIDELFEQACANPGYLPAFQRRLLESFLWVLVRDVPDQDDAIGPFVPVNPLRLATGQLPIFTSEARVREGAGLPADVHWIAVRMRELLTQLQADAVLNPFSAYQMELPLSGREQLLAGSFEVAGLSSSTIQLPKGDYVTYIDNQHETPEALLEALRALLSQHPRVLAGYLMYLGPDERQPASRYHLRLAVEGDEIKQLSQELAPVIRPFVGAGEGFEILAGLTDDDASRYLVQQGAFYERV